MTPLLLAGALAVLAAIAMAGLLAATTRAAMAIAIGVAGVGLGLAAASVGAAGAGVTMALGGGFISVLALAAGAIVGEPRAGKPAPWAALVAGLVALAALVAATGWAPAAAPLRPAATPLLSLPRAGDLFLALATLAGVGAAAASLLGFGERGVLGAARERKP